MVCFKWLRSVVCLFKQKTAYEMRMSDWCSDVCSSDLLSLFVLIRFMRVHMSSIFERDFAEQQRLMLLRLPERVLDAINTSGERRSSKYQRKHDAEQIGRAHV